ncbi:hypothetical protein LZ30DRAFT_708283 [Colletotrichum cereale]|nr:hypothetical protein LZ30DRAFT_708283 [Colletotrichum cereale]
MIALGPQRLCNRVPDDLGQARQDAAMMAISCNSQPAVKQSSIWQRTSGNLPVPPRCWKNSGRLSAPELRRHGVADQKHDIPRHLSRSPGHTRSPMTEPKLSSFARTMVPSNLMRYWLLKTPNGEGSE